MRTATTEIIKTDSTMINFLQKSGVNLLDKEHTHYTFQCCEKRSEHSSHTCVHGMMDLIVETWYENEFIKVSVCHYGEQNGDLMRDPEIVYRVNSVTGSVLPEMYQNDYIGAYQEAVFEKEDKTYVRPSLIKSLKSFTSTWASNLKVQGHTLVKEGI